MSDTSAAATGASRVSPTLSTTIRTTRDHSPIANAEPPMPVASSADETASRIMRLRRRVARTRGYCTTATTSAFRASSAPHSPYGTPR